MHNNYFEMYKSSDNDLCTPVLSSNQIAQILDQTRFLAGDGITPRLWLDAEHLQALNYRTLHGVSDEHRALMQEWHARSPMVPQDLVFLALRSLFCFSWLSPESPEETLYAAKYEAALDVVLLRWSRVLGPNLSAADASLPNWARLSFLRVMAQIPHTAIKEYGLENLACTLIKQPAFHAQSRKEANFSLIGYDYALEPILKSLNRFLLHYYSTNHIAGTRRYERAWNALGPTVLYFFASSRDATTLLRPSILFDEDSPSQAHDLTARQLDHITAHEIGHIVLDHSNKWKGIELDSVQEDHVSHQFEFAADTFAFNILRSHMFDELRQYSQSSCTDSVEQCSDAVIDYKKSFTAIRLLHSYMWFIDSAGIILRHRLDETLSFRPMKNSHPSARKRMQNLMQMCIADIPHRDDLGDYADRLFVNIFKHMECLGTDELLASVRR